MVDFYPLVVIGFLVTFALGCAFVYFVFVTDRQADIAFLKLCLEKSRNESAQLHDESERLQFCARHAEETCKKYAEDLAREKTRNSDLQEQLKTCLRFPDRPFFAGIPDHTGEINGYLQIEYRPKSAA